MTVRERRPNAEGPRRTIISRYLEERLRKTGSDSKHTPEAQVSDHSFWASVLLR